MWGRGKGSEWDKRREGISEEKEVEGKKGEREGRGRGKGR